MNKRLIFIVEGETEKEFVENLLVPQFNSEFGIYDITCFITKRSHGGVSKYGYIKEDILRVVKERDAIVTTMFDFYMIPKDTHSKSVQSVKSVRKSHTDFTDLH